MTILQYPIDEEDALGDLRFFVHLQQVSLVQTSTLLANFRDAEKYFLLFFFMSGVTRSFLAPRTVTELTSPPPRALPPLGSLV